MYAIYLLTDGTNNYVGSTSRGLSARLAEHKYQKRYENFDYKKAKIVLLDVCDSKERFEKENFYIISYSAINKAKASQGPIGSKRSESHCLKQSKRMIVWRSKNKEKIEKAKLNSVFNSQKQKEKSKLAHEAKKKLMPKYQAICKKTGKIFGPYQGYEISKKELNLHVSTLIRCLKHGRKNSLYCFEMVK